MTWWAGAWLEPWVAWTLGGLLGASVWLLVVAVRPPRVDLAAAADRWDHRRQRYPTPTQAAAGRPWSTLLGEWLVTQTNRRGWELTRVRQNLALAERTLQQHLVAKLLMAGFGLLLPTLVGGFLAWLGFAIPLATGALAGLVLATLFFWVPDWSMAEHAARRRADLRRALSCYLDLVAMSMAGGRGVPEALPTAASIGQGWAFELLGHTVATARSTGETPWAALARLGERTGVRELQDLGGALSLVANDGAKVRQSLTARASTARRRALTEAEGDAKKASQTMVLVQILLGLGFVLFLGYPALVSVLAL